MTVTTDSQGRIRCAACHRTLLWLEDGFVRWVFRPRPGQTRSIALPADSPALQDLVVVCECGARWVPTPLADQEQLVAAPEVSGTRKAVGA